MRALAAAATLTVAAAQFAVWLSVPTSVLLAILSVAVLAVGATLVRANGLVSKGDVSGELRAWLRAHLWSHLMPSAYLALDATLGSSSTLSLAFLVPVMAFFLTGTRSWRLLHERFGGAMYRVFQRGNAAFLIMCPLWSAIGLVTELEFAADLYRGPLVFYFSVHLILTGPAIWKISRDLDSPGGVAAVTG